MPSARQKAVHRFPLSSKGSGSIADNLIEVLETLTLKDRYRLFRRAKGIYYVRDTATLSKQSLETTDLVQARRLLAAKNQAIEQPALNKSMAKAYLSGISPEFTTRTWADVMDMYVRTGVESTRDRKERAFNSRPFALLRSVKLIGTEAIHLYAVLEHKKAGNSTHHYLKRIHNFAIHLGWLLSPVMAEAAWPSMLKQHYSAITADEHSRIVERETNLERKLFYQLLWETGGSQSDIANLSWENVDRENSVISFQRKKLMGRGEGSSCLHIGPRIHAILDQLPQSGFFFPKIRLEEPKHRAAEFKRRCRTLKIEGRVLHSYRYAWAQRARTAGMPEREAMIHLGHKSRAIHAAYAGGAQVAVLPLEYYEELKRQKIVAFAQTRSSNISENNNLSEATKTLVSI